MSLHVSLLCNLSNLLPSTVHGVTKLQSWALYVLGFSEIETSRNPAFSPKNMLKWRKTVDPRKSVHWKVNLIDDFIKFFSFGWCSGCHHFVERILSCPTASFDHSILMRENNCNSINKTTIDLKTPGEIPFKFFAIVEQDTQRTPSPSFPELSIALRNIGSNTSMPKRSNHLITNNLINNIQTFQFPAQNFHFKSINHNLFIKFPRFPLLGNWPWRWNPFWITSRTCQPFC